MELTIDSITPNPATSGDYSVKARIGSSEHVFKFVVHEGPVRYVTADDHFRAMFSNDPITAREVYDAVLGTYDGHPSTYPILVSV